MVYSFPCIHVIPQNTIETRKWILSFNLKVIHEENLTKERFFDKDYLPMNILLLKQ
jgi:hypothetical protein